MSEHRQGINGLSAKDISKSGDYASPMKSVMDYPELRGYLEFEREIYDSSHPNSREARTLLVTSHNLLEAENQFMNTLGDYTDDARKFQHIFVRRGANALRAIYLLLQYHSYDAADGRIRYLFETYLLLKGLNEDRSHAAKVWEENKQDVHKTGNATENPLYTYRGTDALNNIIDNQKKTYLWAGRNEKPDEDTIGDIHLKVWRQISNRGSHPHTIKSAHLDGNWASTKEYSTLMLALSLAFGITAQYVRTYKDTPVEIYALKTLDPLFVEIKLAMLSRGLSLPIFLDNEAVFW